MLLATEMVLPAGNMVQTYHRDAPIDFPLCQLQDYYVKDQEPVEDDEVRMVSLVVNAKSDTIKERQHRSSEEFDMQYDGIFKCTNWNCKPTRPTLTMR